MKNKLFTYLALFGVLFMSACDDEELGPVLSTDASLYVSAEMVNSGNTTAFEVTEGNLADIFETFSWTYSGSDYAGIKLPRNYALQADIEGNGFSAPFTIATTSSTDAAVTVKEFNNAALTLGLNAGAEGTLTFRLKTTVEGHPDLDTLYSDSVSYTVIPFRDSDCGTFCSIGLIGSSTLGQWGTDTDMYQEEPDGDRSKWIVITYLTNGGEIKFRAADNWTDDWGDDSAGDGLAGYKEGNIAFSDATGWYEVKFNDNTLEYSVTAVSSTEYTAIGIIGSATPDGWNSDVDLVKGTDVHEWLLDNITLTEADAKFRADDDWADDWGDNSPSFPSGVGGYKQGDIPVTSAGDRAVYFHDVKGTYYFMATNAKDPYSSIGVIGSGSPDGGWDDDVDLLQNPNDPYLWSGFMNLKNGEIKFRADDAWTKNWGGSTPVEGIAIDNSSSNIPVEAGLYYVTFNTGTGEYKLWR